MKRFYFSKLVILIAFLMGGSRSGFAQTTTFSIPGTYTYTVPAGATSAIIDMTGGKGGASWSNSATSHGGYGGRVQCNLTISGGMVLTINVAGAGANPVSAGVGGVGGYNGGGTGGSSSILTGYGGGGGGGASDIRIGGTALSNRVIVAAGGGGGADDCGNEFGGNGGGTTGATGTGCGSDGPGNPGTPTTFGTGGVYPGWGTGGNGALGLGGIGSTGSPGGCGGGGGAGLYGGGAGSWAGGGGGSSFNDPVQTSGATHTSGYNSTGAGYVTINIPCIAPTGGAITGNTPICPGGQTAILSDPTGSAGGVWSSSSTSVATVNSSTGLVTSVGPGTTVITYTITRSCGTASASAVFTVNPNPSSISAPAAVCTGQTQNLTDGTLGGTWSTNSATLATINSSGVIFGVGAGTVTVTYTVSGCITTTPMAVNLSPLPISGSHTVCQFGTTTLTDGTAGGAWSSSFAPVANISPLGVVTGGAAGNATISYTAPNTCVATYSMTTNAAPSQFIVTMGGTGIVCGAGGPGYVIGLSGSSPGVSYQLYDGVSPVGAALTGSGSTLNFGSQNVAGVYTVVATDPSSLCNRTMLSSATITVHALPTPYTVTTPLGGSVCSGGSVSVCLSGSDPGVTYRLFNGVSYVGAPVGGSGSSICFPPVSVAGSYTVVGDSTSGCENNMTGSASVSINPLPNLYNVTGGGNYCAGGSGMVVGLDFSQAGISYQLIKDGGGVGSPVIGTGAPLSFGLQTAGGTYTVTATNITTGCIANMLGSVVISVIPLPDVYDITPAGTNHYCASGTGIDLGTDGSTAGFNYQLYNGITPLTLIASTFGGSLDFGYFTSPGTYTVVAIDPIYGCTATMTGSASIVIDPPPAVFTVGGGGGFCSSGGTGRTITLSGSESGVTYTLYLGLGSVATVGGTGGPLTFGTFTGAGSYTVVAQNDVTHCQSNMSGSAIITIDPPPSTYTVTGGGQYCAGDAGLLVGLDFSSIGVSYQLILDGAPHGSPLSGTGAAISFGLQTSGGTYTVLATNISTTCTATMTGSVTITVNPRPHTYLVTGGGQYCAGGTGASVGLQNSDPGISYQLYISGTPSGSPMAGTGSALDFGLQTVNGVYTIIATDTTTLCTQSMTGLAVIIENNLPAVFDITGGGLYCDGGAGSHVGLSGSNAGVNYQLWLNGTTLVTTMTGSGFPLDFGAQLTPGTYTAVGINASTSCSSNMAGSAVVVINPLPLVYTVTGGGNYCSGGTGMSVGLSGSNSGVNYQLYRGGVAVGTPVAGSGASIDFGLQSAPGTYTVVATDALAGCVKNMSGSAVIGVNSLPASYSVLGGGNYCSGGAGYHIYLSTSATGVNYQLMYGGSPVGTAVAGTGSAIDLGLQTGGGTYTVVATATATGCVNNMTGSATINVFPLPSSHNVVAPDGANYCVTAAGVHLDLDGSETGIRYQLYKNGSTLGSLVNGTGSSIDFGVMTAGTYSVVAINAATACMKGMTDTVTLNAVPRPTLYAVTGGGNYCETGLGVHVGLSGSDAGVSYQLYYGTTATGIPVAGTGSALDFGLKTATGTYTVVASNGLTGCDRNMSSSAVVTVYPVIIPVVHMSTGVGDTVCIGQLTSFTATPINGGSSPTYEWLVNGVSFGTGGSSYSYVPLDGDMVTVRITSNAICAIPDTASRTVKMTVSPQEMPAIHVAADPGDIICQGSPITLTASTSYAGYAPTITWLKNGLAIPVTGLTYTYTPANHDIIVVMMGSNFPCRLQDTVFSNTNTMVVEPSVIPTVAISANPGTHLAAGQSVTFTASVSHGGTAPTYQWLINGITVHGATNSTFTASSLSNGDSVTCSVVGGCALTGFNSVIVYVANVGVQQITASGSDDIRLVPNPNKGVFTLKGTLNNTSAEEVSLEVTNMLGQVIYTNTIAAQNGVIDTRIELNRQLANGMYILNLRSGSQNNIFHFVIEQ